MSGRGGGVWGLLSYKSSYYRVEGVRGRTKYEGWGRGGHAVTLPPKSALRLGRELKIMRELHAADTKTRDRQIIRPKKSRAGHSDSDCSTTYQGAWSAWLKEVASSNISSILLTFDTFQLLSGWLKDLDEYDLATDKKKLTVRGTQVQNGRAGLSQRNGRAGAVRHSSRRRRRRAFG